MYTFLRKYYFLFFILVVTIAVLNFFKSTSTAFPPIASDKNHTLKNSCVKVAAGKQYQKNRLYTFFFGSHYREIWTKELSLNKINLLQFKQQFVPVDTGGNLQTLSLKLMSKLHKSYSLRTVDKDQSKVLPDHLKNTFLTDLLRDQTSALFPYGAPLVASLADHCGILHTNPEIFYFPKTSATNNFRLLQDKIVLLEEAPDETWNNELKFDSCRDFNSTAEFVKILFEGKASIKVDTFQFLKSRLFDFLIGDWDRHSGQWKWGNKIMGSSLMYLPFPKDRDMAFYRFNDGIINKAAVLCVPKLQTFGDNFENIEALAYNGKYLDQILLSTLPEKDFLAAAEQLQTFLKDKTIKRASNKLPKELIPLWSDYLSNILIKRRDKLARAALSYYNFLSKNPLVAGTDLPEKYSINRSKDGTVLKIFTSGSKTFSRSYKFKNSTQSITVYSFGGNDNFQVEGTSEVGPIIKFYCGLGSDTVDDKSTIKGLLKKNWIFDSIAGCVLNAGNDTKDMRTVQQPAELNREGTRR